MYKTLLNKFTLPISDKILGLPITKKLKLWRKLQWLPEGELELIQKRCLKELLIHSTKNVPYYANWGNKIQYDLDDDPLDELKKFPILTKKIIKENLPTNLLDNKRKTHTIYSTSGASGEQGEFHFDKSAFAKAIAIQLLWWEWAGYRFGEKVLQTGMTLKRGLVKGIKDKLLRVKYTQAFEMSSEIVSHNLNGLRGTDDYFFMGYASSLYAYANFAKEMGINNIQFKAAVSWGDKMFPHYRKLIEEQFNTVVFDTYGASEGTMIAAECEYHHYHIMTPHVYIELFDKNGNEAPPGEIGEVVVTRLDNYLMPLIRYRIGDLAVKAEPDIKCPCGRKFPMLEKIIGRDTDIVYTPKGKALIVHFFTGIFPFYKEIEQFQVVQHSLNDIEIKYVPAKDFYPACLEVISQEIFNKAGEKVPIRFSQTRQIFPTASGKPQIVISNLKSQTI